ncbi:beta-fructofuranosidase, soluble isoenzyme I [Lactuca sativa]|uniref:beta-fructofuranosidase, soluble isoenzyme I n=1 Tax=Lactuca sativa TaxID=4236 RepID=UPI000CD8733F|nr:beta-fructofuranosidase, soluble isoenzyme I [Lactuca sativa]
MAADLEHATSTSYSLLPDSDHHHYPPPISQRRRPLTLLSSIFLSMLIFSSLIALILNRHSQPHTSVDDETGDRAPANEAFKPISRGVSQGVSEKSNFQLSSPGADDIYPWTNAMLSWQRTGFHFQPPKNWMNDPNGPLYHMGWYHLFYQYNPDAAVWGNITWGHAISKDLINWQHLPFAMVPDHWYDINGVWTGSATLLHDGKIVMLYTGDTDQEVQVQNLAYPANLSDPLLLDWVKYPGNPVLLPPPGIGAKDFRDPTTAWFNPNGKWRVGLGSKVNKTGITLVYETTDFTSFELLDDVMHAVPGTGMWECVDFYPVSTTQSNGLDTSVNGKGIKHVLKSSLDDNKHDYYALGTYDSISDKWTPDNYDLDVGIGLRLDYGKYYASKTFYDQSTQRRILWGWTGETDSEAADILKGWASVQTIPREVVFDKKTGTNILQWPVKEVEKLRAKNTKFQKVLLKPGSLVPLEVGLATQLDILATFDIDKTTVEAAIEADVGYNCTTSGGSAARGVFGPFGLIVVADESLTEQTPVYFYIAKGADGVATTYFCADESKSSTAADVTKIIYGSSVPVLHGENFSMRLLVDHSIVESFAQGGRTVITSRVYPTMAIYSAAKVFLFNNATGISVNANVNVWKMNSAQIDYFPLGRQH